MGSTSVEKLLNKAKTRTGVVISSGGIHGGTHQIIVEGGEEYTNEQLDFIVKAVDDMEASGWKVASPRHFQQRHY